MWDINSTGHVTLLNMITEVVCLGQLKGELPLDWLSVQSESQSKLPPAQSQGIT